MAATCLAILVPEAESAVDVLRRKYTRDGVEGMPPHITLIYPFTDDAILTARKIGEIRGLLERFPTFDFQLTSVRRFAHRTESHLWLSPHPPSRFVEMIHALEARFPDHPSFGGEFAEVIPHLTVASSSDGETLGAVEAELASALPIHACASTASLMERVDGRWRKRVDFALAATSPDDHVG